MANGSRGTKKQDVEPVKVEEDVVVKEPAKAVAPVVSAPKLHPKVQKTIDDAAPGWRVKIKSKANFDAARAAIKVSNPKGLTIVYKPGLGHHSIASK